MMHEAQNHSPAKTKDYLLSEESIEALTELALLIREVRAYQALHEPDKLQKSDELYNRYKNTKDDRGRRVS